MVNYAYENLFKQNSIDKQIIITDNDSIELINSDIYSESLKLSESLCSEDEIVYGSCEATKLSFTTSDITDSFLGKRLLVSVIPGNVETPLLLGEYVVAEEKLSADRTKKEIVAYDDIYVIHNTNVIEWYRNLTYPISLKNFRDSFFNNLGINFEEITLVNDDMTVEETVDAEVLSGTDVAKAICEINGVLGHIDRNGVFRFISPSSTSVYSLNPSLYKNIKYEDYTVQSITQLQIRQEEDDIGVIVGSSGNAYIIEDNFLVYGKSSEELTTIANNLLPELQGKTYVPCKINCIGNPCLEVGDRITVTKRDNTTFQTFVFTRELNGIQSLADTLASEGSKTRSEKVNGVHYEIQQLKGKSNVLKRTIEETRSTITNVAEGLHSEIVQTAEGIEIQIEDLQSQIDGEVAYYEREGAPTLLNYPYWDFTTSIPCNNTIRLDEIYTEGMVEGGDQFPHFNYSEKNRKDHRSDLCYDTDSNLAYRFVQENSVWYWKEIADTETTQILSRLSTLEATAEELSIEYSEISLDLSQNYYTKVQTDSKITQSASQIQSTVSATYATKTTTNSLQTQITQTASQVSAKANSSGGTSSSFAWSLTPSGFVLTSNNTEVFRCDSTGITITGSGTFTGNIQGATINGSTIKGGRIEGSVTVSSDATFSRLNTNYLSTTDLYVGTRNCSLKRGNKFKAFSEFENVRWEYLSELRSYVLCSSSGGYLSTYCGLDNSYTNYLGTF